MKENVKIIVGNIEDQDTQVIVNPTNAELIWEDETCNGVIMNKVGIQYYHECEKFIDRNGPLDMNEIFWWRGGDSDAEFILNIYPPFWQPANSVEVNVENLYDCYYKCFEVCKETGRTKSISFPLIGSGTFMYPIRTSYKLLENVINDIDVSMFGEIRIVFWEKEQYNLCRHLFE